MDKPIYTDGSKNDCFKLWDRFHYTLTNGTKICIPAKFETDFASIPRIFWFLFPPHWKPYRTAALVHDYLYMDKIIISSRAFADAEFRRILIRDGVNVGVAWLFWACVRLFGRKRFKRYKNQ